jgi:thiol-disulfide isomerase/thioredoxin
MSKDFLTVCHPHLSFALLVLAAALALASAHAGSPSRPPAPDFRLQDDSGGTLRLSQLRGKIVVLNFWATWCAPCRAEMPVLSRIHKQFASQGLAVVGIAADQRGWAAVKPFLAANPVQYPVLLSTPRVARAYGGLKVLPYTVFVDRQGRIVATHSAALTEAQLTRVVEALLAEEDTGPGAPADSRK